MDVVIFFLNKILQEKIYMQQPIGFAKLRDEYLISKLIYRPKQSS